MPLLRRVLGPLGGVAHVHHGVEEEEGHIWDTTTKVVAAAVMGVRTEEEGTHMVEEGEGIEVVEAVAVDMGTCHHSEDYTMGVKAIR